LKRNFTHLLAIHSHVKRQKAFHYLHLQQSYWNGFILSPRRHFSRSRAAECVQNERRAMFALQIKDIVTRIT